MSRLPNLSEVRAADWDHLRVNVPAWRNLGRTWEAAFSEVKQIALNPGGTEWTGPAAQRFQTRTYTDKVKIGGPTDIAENAARIAERGADAQDGNKQSVLDAVAEAERANFQVGEDYSVTDTITWYSSAAELEQRELEAQQHESFIKSRVINLVNNEHDIARQLTTATADLHEFSFGDEGDDGGAGAADRQPHAVPVDDRWTADTDRVHNQRKAFNNVYGRDPVSDNDWLMAAALDPHSYDPKYHGVPPEIVAGRIAPQPGKGVVRSNMFIPADHVYNVPKDLTDLRERRFRPDNAGDNRGPNANADIDASRVSVFVDYDRGLVVVRQNPTSAVDGQRGGAATAAPDVHVVQASDGRVTIDYNAHDAYEWTAATNAGATVNGRITFAPHADGTIGLGGSTTTYPSMETYQYRDGAAPAQLQWSPANSGSPWGPGTSLERHHWVGDTSIHPVRPDMPGWKWELENAIPHQLPSLPPGPFPFASLFPDPFRNHTTQLTDPFQGAVPTVAVGR